MGFMRHIAIIGAGQAGLQLAIGLVQSNYAVTLYSNRTSKQILNGRIMSNQGMFESSLKLERALGLNFWDKTCPKNSSVTVRVADATSTSPSIHWIGSTQYPYISIDQRLKFSQWMNHFEKLGGNLEIEDVQKNDLDNITKEYDLTILATGKGNLSSIFQRNNQASTFSTPQRSLACLYVKGMIPMLNNPGIRMNIIPGVGEYCIMPGLTRTGHCEMMLFEGVPGGPFDCWKDIQNTAHQLEVSLKLLKKYIPLEADYCQQIEPTDDQASLTGQYTPFVNQPISKLPSGRLVFGIGDAVVLNDPIAGQGANNAAKAANLYLNNIKAHRNEPFDELWMNRTFNNYWNTVAKSATQWTNMLLLPLEPHIVELMKTAMADPTISNIIADAFDEPSSLFPWINSQQQTRKFIQGVQQLKKSYSSTYRPRI